MNRKVWLTCLSLGLLGFAVASSACGDDDGATPTPDPAALAEVEETATRLLETDTTDSGQLDYFFEHITAAGVTYFGYPTAEECAANAEDCIGDPAPVNSLSDTTINGDNASTTADTENGIIKVVLKQEEDVWKLNGYAFLSDVPDGTNTIDVTAVDFSYEWAKSGVKAGEPVAFRMKNEGQQTHMIVVAAVEDDFDPQAMIDSIADLGPDAFPVGVAEYLDGFTAATPGETGSVLFTGMETGKYTFICFIPDPEGKQHVELGMYSEFEVTE